MLIADVCLSLCMLATLPKNFQTDLHELFREGWHWASEQKVKFWWRSGSGIASAITGGRLGYCNSLLYCFSGGNLDRLQKVQKFWHVLFYSCFGPRVPRTLDATGGGDGGEIRRCCGSRR